MLRTGRQHHASFNGRRWPAADRDVCAGHGPLLGWYRLVELLEAGVAAT